MGLVCRDDGWRMPDWLWERIEPLLPPRPFTVRTLITAQNPAPSALSAHAHLRGPAHLRVAGLGVARR
jgi:hypothetical protein